MAKDPQAVKGDTLLQYGLMKHPEVSVIAVCAPCFMVITNKNLDECPKCGYALKWNRREKINFQGIRSDYFKALDEEMEARGGV